MWKGKIYRIKELFELPPGARAKVTQEYVDECWRKAIALDAAGYGLSTYTTYLTLYYKGIRDYYEEHYQQDEKVIPISRKRKVDKPLTPLQKWINENWHYDNEEEVDN